MPVFPLDRCPLPPPDLVIEDAQFVYRTNFEGRAETYNEEGDRYFNVRIPDNIVEAVQADNWNLSWTKPGKNHPNPQDHVSEPFLKVNVGFKYRPPYISVFDNEKETVFNEETAGNLDVLQFEKVDLVIRGRDWKNTSGCGIKAWLKTFTGVVETDVIRQKYAHLRD